MYIYVHTHTHTHARTHVHTHTHTPIQQSLEHHLVADHPLVVHDPKECLPCDVALALGVKHPEGMPHGVVMGPSQLGRDLLHNLYREGEGWWEEEEDGVDMVCKK